jgi:hypothetical protein
MRRFQSNTLEEQARACAVFHLITALCDNGGEYYLVPLNSSMNDEKDLMGYPDPAAWIRSMRSFTFPSSRRSYQERPLVCDSIHYGIRHHS